MMPDQEAPEPAMKDLHHMLDWECGPDWSTRLDAARDKGVDLNGILPETGEALLSAGATTRYPEGVQARKTYHERLFENPPPAVRAVLVELLGKPVDPSKDQPPTP